MVVSTVTGTDDVLLQESDAAGGPANDEGDDKGGALSTLASRPTLVECGAQRYLIMDAPRDENLHIYLKACKQARITDLVRVCAEQTYAVASVEAAGLRMHEMPFADGECPQPEVVDEFLRLVKKTVTQNANGANAGVAVHCVAGLGRAPLLVAIALIELGKMDALEAVEYIRVHRRGAINARQLTFLQQYAPKRSRGCSCSVS
jgi:protein tyrosine phosphatase type 4A